jgi:uncharacterized membrane protein
MNNAGKTALGLDANVGAGLCYVGNLVCALGLIYSIIVVVTDKTNKLARFHAFQSILLSAAGIVLAIAVNILAAIAAAANSGILAILLSVVMLVVYLGLFILVIIAAIKAFQGQIYKLPFIGDMADGWSN